MTLDNWYTKAILADPQLQDLSVLKNKKICVMGGCGQVGSHTVTALYQLGCDVDNIYINDDLSLGVVENLPAALREGVDWRSHIEFARDPKCSPDILIFVGGRSSAPHFTDLSDI